MRIYMKDDEVTVVGGDDPTDGYVDPLDCLVKKEIPNDDVYVAPVPPTGDGTSS